MAISARRRRWLPVLLSLTLAGLGFAALHALTRELAWHQVRDAARALPPWRLAACLGFTSLSYLTLSLYDLLALRLLGRRLEWRKAAFGAFSAYALSHSLGLSPLTGGSVRLRVYGREGVPPGEVAWIVVIASLAFWTGIALTGAAALLLGPQEAFDGWARSLGLALVGAVACLLCLASFRARPLRLFGLALPLPRPHQAAGLIAVAILDILAAAAALFVLLPGLGMAHLPSLVAGFALACTAGGASHVPGGVGVFEAVLVSALPGRGAGLVAAMILYRLIYYLLPLVLASAGLVIGEGRRLRLGVGRAYAGARSLAGAVSPPLIALLVFLGGAVLLVSGSLPAIPGRLHALHAFLPLPFIEASHLAASLVGTALLLLSPGLYRRLDGAFLMTRALLVSGAIFSLGKGIDYEEALLLVALAALLQWTRPAFYRRTAMTEPVSPRWALTILLAVGASIWIGFFAYRHVAYSSELWWHFAVKGEASRFLRASLGAAVLLLGWTIARLLAPGPARPAETLPEDVAERALAAASSSEALLAFTGDKRFILSRARDAFLMYGVRGRTWIAIGDPVGPRESWPELLWSIRARADAAQARLLLYQIGPDLLPLAVELGLTLLKYGEEARVDLTRFSLEGGGMRGLRQSARRAARDGAAFEVVPAAAVAAILPELERVSDEWLRVKGQREKGFSVGRFDPAYLRRFDCAVVRWRGRIVAFANLWPMRGELSVDLMRHAEFLPYGAMDYLFVQLMLWGRARGFTAFSLGMAPLSGIEARRLSPAWAKIAAFVFRHGGAFYGFAGVRAYKEKFAPEWRPRFVAGPRGFALLRALVDLKALVSAPPGQGQAGGGELSRPATLPDLVALPAA